MFSFDLQRFANINTANSGTVLSSSQVAAGTDSLGNFITDYVKQVSSNSTGLTITKGNNSTYKVTLSGGSGGGSTDGVVYDPDRYARSPFDSENIVGLDLSHFVDGTNFEYETETDGTVKIRNGSSSYNVNSGISRGYVEVTTTQYSVVTVVFSIGSEGSYDYGGCIVSEDSPNTTFTLANLKAANFFSGSGVLSKQTVTYMLDADKTYYLNFGYMKDGSNNSNGDRFYIYEINIVALSRADKYMLEYLVVGNPKITGSPLITGSPSLSSGSSLKGAFVISGNVKFTGSPSVTGSPSLSSSASLKGAFVVPGNVKFTGNPSLSGNPTLSGTTTFTGDVNFQGDVTFNNSGGFSEFFSPRIELQDRYAQAPFDSANIVGLDLSHLVDGTNFELDTENLTDGAVTRIRSGSASYNVDSGISRGYVEVVTYGRCQVVVVYSISSQSSYDYGGCIVTEDAPNTEFTLANLKAANFFYKAGSYSKQTVTYMLAANKTYYLNFGYAKNASTNSNDDRFYIHSIRVNSLDVEGVDAITVFTGADATLAGTGGIVPAPLVANRTQFLRGDCTWATPTNTTYSVATTTSNGLMSASDKTKLNNLNSTAMAISTVSGTAEGSIWFEV